MGWDAPWHWVVLAIIVIALFGYKKLPDASRSLGRSLRIFKTEIKGMSEDDKARDAAQESTPVTPMVKTTPLPAVAPAEPVVAETPAPSVLPESTPVTTPAPSTPASAPVTNGGKPADTAG